MALICIKNLSKYGPSNPTRTFKSGSNERQTGFNREEE